MVSISKYVNLFNDFSDTFTNQENLGLEDDEVVFRGCFERGGLGDFCDVVDISGVSATICFCTTDNCNKDLLCDCPSSQPYNTKFVMERVDNVAVLQTMENL